MAAAVQAWQNNMMYFRDYLKEQQTDNRKKLLFVLDQGVIDHHPDLQDQIKNYIAGIPSFSLAGNMIMIPGVNSQKMISRHLIK